MSNTGFYIFALVAIVIAGFILKHVVTCLMRSIVVVALLIILAVAYYFLVGQYDPEVHDAVQGAWDKYQTKE